MSCSSYRHASVGPWVTSVGGTTSESPEIAASISGGGFSYYFPRPDYQKYAVPTYFQNTEIMYQGKFKFVRSHVQSSPDLV